MNLSVAIQHHPSRAERLPALMRALGEPVDLVSDPEPAAALRSPWRTAQLAWRSSPASATHRLVVQDDIIPCAGFLSLARAALSERPDDVVSFYVGRYPGNAARQMLQALYAGESWCDIGIESWTPCLALAMPTALAHDLAGHTDRFSYPAALCADDGIVSYWRQERSLACWATVPSLVDHDNEPTSLMGTEGERIAIVAHSSLPHNKNRLGGQLDLAF